LRFKSGGRLRRRVNRQKQEECDSGGFCHNTHWRFGAQKRLIFRKNFTAKVIIESSFVNLPQSDIFWKPKHHIAHIAT
jgi:hypothetical protein